MSWFSAVLLTLSIGLAGMVPVTATAQPSGRGPVISISATGSVSAEPDAAVVMVGVATEDAAAKVALDANSKAMAAVIAGMKELGIATKDLATQQIVLAPKYRRNKGASSSRSEIDGFTVRNMLQIQVRKLDQLGTVLDRATELGANQIGGIRFVVSTAEDLMDEARRNAVATARHRAQLYAEAAGVKLGEVLSLSESNVSTARGQVIGTFNARSSVPVEAGVQRISVRVKMVWSIED
ncbi:MAG: SIMPL domain-containing protein [Pseudomonadota bacterium]